MAPLGRAHVELRSFGRIWLAGGFLLAAVPAATGAFAHLSATAFAAAVLLLGLSLSLLLGSYLLGRRTDPIILYTRILDRAPPAPGLPIELPRATFRRVIPPAVVAVAIFTALSVPFFAAVVLLLGEPRRELSDSLPAAFVVASGWTLSAGAVGLRVAGYLRHWEQRRGMAVLCPPLRAGLLRHVYFVSKQGE
jgi:hypothetical protein